MRNRPRMMNMRSVGMVPVRLGEISVVQVPVFASDDGVTRLELGEQGPRIVLREGLDEARQNRAVAALMPTIVRALSARVLN